MAALRAFDRKQILDRIEKQLTHQPAKETRNKKIIIGLILPREHAEPVWELRAGKYRVFRGNLMKTVSLEQTTLDTCVQDAQRERVIITCNGIPVALIIGLEGMDEEQIQLGSSDKFWQLIAKRRQQKTVSRAELEQRISSKIGGA